MRVEAYNQVAQLYNREKTQKVQNTKQAVADASDIREDRVAQLKERLDSGNYNVDMNDFANKLLEKYNALVK